MDPSRSTAHARITLVASLLLLAACSAPRHVAECDAGRWQISRTEGGILLLDSVTGDLWRLENLSESECRWALVVRGPTAPERPSAASSGAR